MIYTPSSDKPESDTFDTPSSDKPESDTPEDIKRQKLDEKKVEDFIINHYHLLIFIIYLKI